MGGLDKLLETLRQRLAEQKGRHQGGSKWIGTAGTSPYGAYGYNPEGVRIGQDGNRNNRAVKVWDKREFRNLDDQVELGTRNIKIALRRLRRSRARAPPRSSTCPTPSAPRRGTPASSTSSFVPERHNAVKVLLLARHRRLHGRARQGVRGALLGGARRSSSISSIFYFHNCLYEIGVEGQPPAPRRAHADASSSCTPTTPTTSSSSSATPP